jgi:DNA-binding PucR family transcriptional regulator
LESLAARAGEYGLNLNRAHVIVRVQYAVGSGQSDFVDSDTRRQHLQQRIESILSDVALPLASTGVPGADVLLLEVPTEDVLSSTVQIQTILSAAMPGLVERFGARAVVVSDACRSISDLSVVGGEVRELAELLVQQPGQPDVVAARDLTLLRLVAQSDGLSSAFDYATRLLRPLRSHDQTTGSDLAETLQAFINHDAQVKATAQVLGVHENTVRYRLRRIQEISTIDPERIMSLAAAHLAFQIQAFRHSSACDAAPSGDRVRP